MRGKRVCLVINPHAGQNVTRLADLVAVLAAAGWRTDIAIKEYGGQSMELAARAAKAKRGLIIGYGGDGTLNQVLNGVMAARARRSVIGVIPGGTANVWATEMGVPTDPVKAALSLCSSQIRKVDLGHVEVERLAFPGTARDEPDGRKQEKTVKREAKAPSKARHHFLLMAGLGIDAAIMEHVSKSLKYRVGPLAVGLSAVEELPKQHPFPVEIRIGGGPRQGDGVWKGEALLVVIGNTRRYANILQMTPGAYLDDGLLDVCVLTAGNALTTLEQIASLVLRRRPDNVTTERFQGASIAITVPASIDLQLDGSAVRLKDYLSKSEHDALESAENAQQVLVTYRFDALPRALEVAIPCAYAGTLFEQPRAYEKPLAALQQHKHEEAPRHDAPAEEMQREPPELISTLLEEGHKVTVRGVAAQPGNRHRYIIAGTVPHQQTGDTAPVAARVDDNTRIFRHSGEQVAPALLLQLPEGAVLVADGKKSKYGVIRARHILI